ncbi:protein LemA [Methanocalculus chunghsingensis]|uniref:Protein LemA n=1 Tax=Methanocalculus chunghsingensis TaxID=156457 RepID=A0A8J7W983_9EURY|nr:LemA family protein [Methanocalculus chunghsingensis]MBR1368467.1 protein LemA [Methanocalculus chunghsingensis]
MLDLIIGGILLLLVIGIILWFVSVYNRYYRLKNGSEATLGQIKVAMKKRLDMIDQLLGSVKSYAEFEKSTLESVTKMRASVGSAGPGDLNAIEAESRSVLGRLFAVMENYPDLKTAGTVKDLMGSIKILEDEIARHRYTFNNISQQFNTMLQTIPSNIVGNMIGMQKLEYLEFEDENLAKAPKIEF